MVDLQRFVRIWMTEDHIRILYLRSKVRCLIMVAAVTNSFTALQSASQHNMKRRRTSQAPEPILMEVDHEHTPDQRESEAVYSSYSILFSTRTVRLSGVADRLIPQAWNENGAAPSPEILVSHSHDVEKRSNHTNGHPGETVVGEE
eukprot:gb/GEZJ01002734.1/.p2 GENE.gb/GEZJ01002734.1/~~gb/GEZJ01002734.1/.p2  ORF type:complete len:146 (+),score=21.47 gb/GEZJ01002734.1/:2204-2641(+)